MLQSSEATSAAGDHVRAPDCSWNEPQLPVGGGEESTAPPARRGFTTSRSPHQPPRQANPMWRSHEARPLSYSWGPAAPATRRHHYLTEQAIKHPSVQANPMWRSHEARKTAASNVRAPDFPSVGGGEEPEFTSGDEGGLCPPENYCPCKSNCSM